MAKSLLTVLIQSSRAMERDRQRRERASEREHAISIRKLQQAQKAEERAILKMQRADAADSKAMEKAAKLAHIETMQAESEERNFELAAYYEEIDSLLQYTLGIDDYVDLEELRRTEVSPPFDAGELAIPHEKPTVTELPVRPQLEQPEKPKGLFGKKAKIAKATAEANLKYNQALSAWEVRAKKINTTNKREVELHKQRETLRLENLQYAEQYFKEEVIAHNENLDDLINRLGYGTVEAVEEYISLVLSNSVYPEHFPVNHHFTFVPATAELNMTVSVPPPGDVKNVKAYKYKKVTDEIDSTLLSVKAQKDRYSGAVNNVAIRSLHEVFEADRRGLIKAISLEVGTEHIVPSTGKNAFIPFVAVAAERDTFMEFELSGIVPMATLKHIGAAISKNPFELVAVDVNGIRRS